MSVLDTLNNVEKEAMEKFQLRMKDVLPPDKYADKILFYRFLKARDFDIDKAEEMLRKNIIWRKATQFDVIVDSFELSEVFHKYFEATILGFDKAGSIIGYLPAGKIEVRNLLKCMRMDDAIKCYNIQGERALRMMDKENEKTGRHTHHGIIIFDLDKLTFSNATYNKSAVIMLKIAHILQDNYPERLKTCYVINAPPYYVWIYSIIKRMMSQALAQKIRVFSQTGWKEELLKEIDADVLPAFLGGKRTDPDGNPLCLDTVIHCSKAPPECYLTNEQRWFKDLSQVEKIVVLPMEQNKIPVKVEEYKLVIEWRFECRNKDIGFGLFFQDLENEEEILPIQKFSTPDGTENGFHTAQRIGTYIILFDNSYSWLSSKEVRYCITVKKPNY